MSYTYKAVEVTRPGVFSLTQRQITDPPAGQVRIRVEACGICHSDSGTDRNHSGLTDSTSL
jgi:propanol-preferring alcohol dehydrogenase